MLWDLEKIIEKDANKAGEVILIAIGTGRQGLCKQ
jgi:hypothetical protein